MRTHYVSEFESVDSDQPALDSPDYAAAFNEVKSWGRRLNSTRTADQTQIARFWSYDRGSLGTVTTRLNEVLRTIATATANSPIENAELFARANIAMADAADDANGALVGFWRPETGNSAGGNRRQCGDGRRCRVAAAWAATSLATGAFTPSGPSDRCYHAAMGGAMFEVLRKAYGKDNMKLRSQD